MALREKTNQELFSLYEDDLALRLHNAKNLKDTKTLLNHFMEFLGQFPPSPELSKSFLARYAKYNTYTLSRYTQMVKAFMQWYGEPLTDIHIKTPKSLPSYTEDTDIEKLLAVIGDKKSHKKLIERDRLLIETALKTGMRRAELANLKPEDIHEDALIVRQGKGQKDRMIPLSSDMANRLQSFVKDHKPGQSVFGLGPPWISMKVKQYAIKAGLSNIHTHTLRHKFATDLLESGVDLKVVQALLGHQNLNTTEVYLSLTDQRLHDAIAKRDQHKTTSQALNKIPEGASVNKGHTGLESKPGDKDPSLDPQRKTVTTTHDEQTAYVETPHKQQIRETAKILLSQINFPFIGDRLKDALTVTMESPQKPKNREWFAGNTLCEGLRSHLETGGYVKVLQDIADFDNRRCR